MKNLLALPYANVYLHQGTHAAIEVEWLGFTGSSGFREVAAETLRLGLENDIKGWVADDRLLGAVRPKDLEWIQHRVLLPLSHHGAQRFALLESQDGLNRFTIDRMYEEPELVNASFELRRFTNIEAARAWACGD